MKSIAAVKQSLSSAPACSNIRSRAYRYRRIVSFALAGSLFSPCLASARAADALDNRTPSTGLLSVRAIAFNPANGKLYAVDTRQGTVSVISGPTHTISTVKVGAGPVAVAVNPATNKVYVANHGSGTLSVLAGDTNAVVASIPVGKTPYVVAVNPSTNKIYVSNTFNNQITIIDGVTNATKTVAAGSADQITVDPEGNKIYLLGYESSSLTVLDGIDDSITHMPVGEMHLWAIALSPASSEVYVTRIGSGDVVALDEKSTASIPVSTGKIPCAIAINSKTNTLYVANYGDDSVTVIDGSKHVAVATVHVGAQPHAIAVDAKTNLIYVANTHGNSVTVIDGVSNVAVTSLEAGINPYAITVDSQNGMVYVANMDQQSFTQIDVHQLSRRFAQKDQSATNRKAYTAHQMP